VTQIVELTVGEYEAGHRLDVFIAQRLPWRSRASLVAFLRSGAITVNGVAAKKAHRLLQGDRVALELPKEDPGRELAEIPLDVLFEDDDLVVVDKPAGLAVHPASTCLHVNLLRRLELRYRVEIPQVLRHPAVVHRLDRGTSGVIAFARRREDVAYYTSQFERRSTTKVYVALVHGCPPAHGTIDLPITIVPQRPVRIDAAGKPSRTDFRCLATAPSVTLVGIRLHTGRKHQIRAHFAALGHPLVGDDVYGAPDPRDALPMLHAASLELEHRTRGRMRFCAPLPKRFAIAWEALAGEALDPAVAGEEVIASVASVVGSPGTAF